MKKSFKFIVLAGALALMGLGCKKGPEQVISAMQSNMSDISSVAFMIDYKSTTMSPSGEPLPEEDIEGKVEGKVLIDQDKFTDWEVSIDAKSFGEKEGEIKASLVQVKGDLYAKLENVSELAAFSKGEDLPFDPAAFLNKWIIFPAELRENLPSGVKKDLETDDTKEILKAFKGASLFKDVKDLGGEEVRGVKTTKYSFKIDEDQAIKLAKRVAEIQEEEFTAEDEQEARDDIKKFNEKESLMWISNKDKRLRRLEVHPEGQSTDEGNTQNIDLTVELYDFNKVDSIQAPEGVSTIEDVMKSLIGGSLFEQLEDIGKQFENSGSTDFEVPDFDFSKLEELQKSFGQ